MDGRSSGHLQVFPVRFTGANRAMHLLGLHRGNAYVDVGVDTMRVRMGWAFDVSVHAMPFVPRAGTMAGCGGGASTAGGVSGW